MECPSCGAKIDEKVAATFRKTDAPPKAADRARAPRPAAEKPAPAKREFMDF